MPFLLHMTDNININTRLQQQPPPVQSLIYQMRNQREEDQRTQAWRAVRNAVPGIRITPNGPRRQRTFHSEGENYIVTNEYPFEGEPVQGDLLASVDRVGSGVVCKICAAPNGAGLLVVLYGLDYVRWGLPVGLEELYEPPTLPSTWRLEAKAVISALRQLIYHWHPRLRDEEWTFQMPLTLASHLVYGTPVNFNNAPPIALLDERTVMQALFNAA